MLSKLTIVAALLLSLAIGATPANAITDGDLDGNAHPYVGLMVAKAANDTPLWRCSGTLMSPRKRIIGTSSGPRYPRQSGVSVRLLGDFAKYAVANPLIVKALLTSL